MSALEPHYNQIDPRALEPINRVPLHIVLDNIRSAFNVGSIFRTADAGAVAHMHLCGMTAYPPNTKLEKTALGAMSYVPWSYYRDTEEALAWLRADQIPCVALEAVPDAPLHFDYAWPQPVAILFGNEVTGVSESVQAQCVQTVQIPMHGFKNTINVATAFGVVMYEILRQWRIPHG